MHQLEPLDQDQLLDPLDQLDQPPKSLPNALREELSQTMTEIHAKGWAIGTGGNFSVVSSRDPLRLLMAPSGVDKGKVQPDDLIEVDQAGFVIAGSGRASAETLLHLAIVAQAGAGSVLHTHSVFNTILSEFYCDQGFMEIAGYEMLKGLAGVTSHETTVRLPILLNSQDMRSLTQAFQALWQSQPGVAIAHGVLISGHGLYAWGADLFTARRHLEILEFLMEVTYRKQLLGGSKQ
jgi:methylthioribulose-1-phosphate dehydratase